MIRLALLIVLAVQSAASACLWDYDTIADERRGLPGVAEIIAGRWERHSDAFYRQRITAMENRLANHPDDWAAWDNLAVAHEKVGEVDKAIAVALDKDARSPGQYTTEANLGTFYIHGGDYARGIEHVRRALELNPNAHFGRERYQLQIAEFLQHPPAADADGAVGSFVVPMLGLAVSTSDPADWTVAVRMRMARMGRPGERRPAIDSAIEGVVGMIRFGNAASPHLYYALGDLLAARGDANLAYRAYLRAIELNHPNPKEVREAADAARRRLYSPGDLNAEYATARKAADAWVAAYQAYERQLLTAGRDAEDETNYAPFYAANGSPREPVPWGPWIRWSKETLIVAIAVTALSGYLIVRTVQHVYRKRVAVRTAPV